MRVLFAGGGTGGHINPAISIADYVAKQDKDFKALFVGTKSGLETKLVPKAGYDIEYIEIQGFDRKHIFRNFETVKKLISARRKCNKIIKEFKPDCIVCTGGYVSGPVAMASKKMKVPSLIHEQNVYPGMTVKGSANYVTYLALSFEETINHMQHKEKCVVTGNPIRSEILHSDYKKSREKLGINLRFVLFLGGCLFVKILIVGHDAEITAIVGKILRRSGYEITCCADKDGAAELIEKQNIRLVIADLEADEKERICFCKTIKNMAKPPKLLFIGNSGEEESKILNAGADDWIKKPYKTAVFLARTGALMRRCINE